MKLTHITARSICYPLMPAELHCDANHYELTFSFLKDGASVLIHEDASAADVAKALRSLADNIDNLEKRAA